MCLSLSACCFFHAALVCPTCRWQGRSCNKWTKSAASTAKAAAIVSVSQSHPVRGGRATYTQTCLEINFDDLSE